LDMGLDEHMEMETYP